MAALTIMALGRFKKVCPARPRMAWFIPQGDTLVLRAERTLST